MEYISILKDFELWDIVLILFALIFLCEKAFKAYDWLLIRFGVKTKSTLEKEQTKTEMQAIKKMLTDYNVRLNIIEESNTNRFNTIDDNLTKIADATRESLAQKINDKYHKYFSLEYIPEDEYDEFITLHDAYKGVGGNHSGDEKYNRCMSNLPVKPIKEDNKYEY